MSETQRVRQLLEATFDATKAGKIEACIDILEACVCEAQKICGPDVLVLFLVNTGDEGDRVVSDSSIERINQFVGPNYRVEKVEDE